MISILALNQRKHKQQDPEHIQHETNKRVIEHYKTNSTVLKRVLVKLVFKNASIEVENAHCEEVPDHEVEVGDLPISLLSALYIDKFPEDEHIDHED